MIRSIDESEQWFSELVWRETPYGVIKRIVSRIILKKENECNQKIIMCYSSINYEVEIIYLMTCS